MTIFPIYVRSLGGTLDSVSDMWILMLSLEIPLIALSGSSLARFGPRGLLAIGTLAGGVRWTACGLIGDLSIVFPFQILHGVVVAGLVVGGPLYVEAIVPERLRSTGQGVLAMVGVSLGAVASHLGSGWLLEHAGPRAPYLVGGIGSLAARRAHPVAAAAGRAGGSRRGRGGRSRVASGGPRARASRRSGRAACAGRASRGRAGARRRCRRRRPSDSRP